MSAAGIGGVAFDLGGVVLESPLAAIRGYEAECGIAAGAIGRALAAMGSDGAWSRLERGELGFEAFLPRLEAELATAGLALDARALMDRVERAMVARPEMVALVDRVRDGGQRVAAVTNNWRGNEAMDDLFERLAPHFDGFLESCRGGRRKPEPAIYALICERLELAPDRIAFLDDIGHNLKPARAMGMHTIKVDDDPAAAIAALESLLA